MRNRQVTVQKRMFFSVFAVAACLFFFACGIPVYYVIEPPQADHIPTADTGDISQKYFSFICPYSSSSENSDFSLTGTEIYYRIYNNVDEMNSDISSINGRNSEYSENGYRRMTELNYQEMWSDKGDFPIIKKTNASRTIRIRLCAEGSYKAEIFDETNNNTISVPYRKGTGSTNSGNMSFEFTSSYHPDSDDQDTKITSSEQEDIEWYVNLYAVTVGKDTSLSQQYSSVLHLGSLKITQTQ